MFKKESKIYIAGHTGLLGSAILKKLTASGYTGIITRTHNELDLMDKTEVDEFFKDERPEYVFLSAGLTGGIMANKTYPATFFHTNISIQDNVFESALKYDAERLIFYGSSCIYPKNSPQPIKEEYLLNGYIEETSEAYASAKISGIIACKAYNSQYKINRFISLIPNSIYGPNDNFNIEGSHVLSALIRKFHDGKTNNTDKVILWGSGNPRREFIFSEDIAEASIFTMSLNGDKLKNVYYNVGTGIDYSIKELAEMVSNIIGFTGNIEWDKEKPDGTYRKLLDSTRFLSLGFTPLISLETGIKAAYNWYLENLRNK
ncbi:MAG: GDP-L-fucose synthase family protein [bacterium]